MTPDLPVIRTLGGCGGTLVSRLFAALPGALVLSETNPRSACLFGGHLNPLAQLRKWRPALLEGGLAELDDDEIGYPPRFGEMLSQLHAALAVRGERLVVRDFNYADFIGVPFAWPPARDCSLDAAAVGRFKVRDLRLVRHPADQLASLRTHRAIEFVLAAERFVDGCLGFLEVCAAAPLFRYEALTAAPETTFEAMCQALGLDFDPRALTAFGEVTAVTGNLARAADAAIAAPPRSAAALRAQDELDRVPAYAALLAALGYAAIEG